MFDFTPVGLACAFVGVLFVTLVGWRLLPADRASHDSARELLDASGYIAELHVPEGSQAIGKHVRDLDGLADENDVAIVGLVRRGRRLPGQARLVEIRSGDILVVDAAPEAMDKFVGELKLDYSSKGKDTSPLSSEDMSLWEVVVPDGARVEGRTAHSLKLQYRHGVTLLGVSRQGKQFRERVRHLQIREGDVLLLYGSSDMLAEISYWLGALPLAGRSLDLIQAAQGMAGCGLVRSGDSGGQLRPGVPAGGAGGRGCQLRDVQYCAGPPCL